MESNIATDRKVALRVTVNGRAYERSVEPRLLLSDFLRHELDLTGTHVGCEHGVCGACTVLLDGEAVRSCLMFAVQTDGCEITTVEGLKPELPAGVAGETGVNGPAGDAAAASPLMRSKETPLHVLQEAFRDTHGLQCGFCTPGILMTMVPFLADNPSPHEAEIRLMLSGHLCRCTGYQNIVKAVQLAAERLQA